MAKAREVLKSVLAECVRMAILRDDPTTGEVEFEVDVTLDSTPPSRGHRGPYGELLEPDEPGSVEVISAERVDDGQPIELTPEEEQEAVERFMDQSHDLPEREPPDTLP